jgi:predicted  nucleic acid-binding Zn ribbon protein
VVLLGIIENKASQITLYLFKKHFATGGTASMAVWKLKSCPRCNGDLFIQREIDGWYEECLSCGYQRDVSNLVTVDTVGRVKINQ